MHLREKQGSAQGNHRHHLPRSARVHEDQDEESVCSEKNQGSQRKRTAPGEKGKDQHHRTEGIHRDSHVYKRHRPIPSRTELAGQRQQSWKSVERWPPRIASEPLRYVAMPEISPGYSTSKLAICSVEGLLAQLWPADWVPAATAGVGRSLRARCQPKQCRGTRRDDDVWSVCTVPNESPIEVCDATWAGRITCWPERALQAL